MGSIILAPSFTWTWGATVVVPRGMAKDLQESLRFRLNEDAKNLSMDESDQQDSVDLDSAFGLDIGLWVKSRSQDSESSKGPISTSLSRSDSASSDSEIRRHPRKTLAQVAREAYDDDPDVVDSHDGLIDNEGNKEDYEFLKHRFLREFAKMSSTVSSPQPLIDSARTTSTTISVFWDAVGGDKPTYTLQIRNGEGLWTTVYQGYELRKQVHGLTPMTTYHFRLKSQATSWSDFTSFTTAPPSTTKGKKGKKKANKEGIEDGSKNEESEEGKDNSNDKDTKQQNVKRTDETSSNKKKKKNNKKANDDGDDSSDISSYPPTPPPTPLPKSGDVVPPTPPPTPATSTTSISNLNPNSNAAGKLQFKKSPGVSISNPKNNKTQQQQKNPNAVSISNPFGHLHSQDSPYLSPALGPAHFSSLSLPYLSPIKTAHHQLTSSSMLSTTEADKGGNEGEKRLQDGKKQKGKEKAAKGKDKEQEKEAAKGKEKEQEKEQEKDQGKEQEKGKEKKAKEKEKDKEKIKGKEKEKEKGKEKEKDIKEKEKDVKEKDKEKEKAKDKDKEKEKTKGKEKANQKEKANDKEENDKGKGLEVVSKQGKKDKDKDTDKDKKSNPNPKGPPPQVTSSLSGSPMLSGSGKPGQMPKIAKNSPFKGSLQSNNNAMVPLDINNNPKLSRNSSRDENPNPNPKISRTSSREGNPKLSRTSSKEENAKLPSRDENPKLSKLPSRDENPKLSKTSSRDENPHPNPNPKLSRNSSRDENPKLPVRDEHPKLSKTSSRDANPKLSRASSRDENPKPPSRDDLKSSRTSSRDENPNPNPNPKPNSNPNPKLSRNSSRDENPKLSKTTSRDENPKLSRNPSKDDQQVHPPSSLGLSRSTSTTTTTITSNSPTVTASSVKNDAARSSKKGKRGSKDNEKEMEEKKEEKKEERLRPRPQSIQLQDNSNLNLNLNSGTTKKTKGGKQPPTTPPALAPNSRSRSAESAQSKPDKEEMNKRGILDRAAVKGVLKSTPIASPLSFSRSISNDGELTGKKKGVMFAENVDADDSDSEPEQSDQDDDADEDEDDDLPQKRTLKKCKFFDPFCPYTSCRKGDRCNFAHEMLPKPNLPPSRPGMGSRSSSFTVASSTRASLNSDPLSDRSDSNNATNSDLNPEFARLMGLLQKSGDEKRSAPTADKSKSPTTPVLAKLPSGTPSLSKQPSNSPSLSKQPSGTPSLSKQPSNNPPLSNQPSGNPSLSKQSSDNPLFSKQMSNNSSPSKQPSNNPSLSKQPSNTPSLSKQPSNNPSLSKQPSNNPLLSKQASGTATSTPVLNLYSAEVSAYREYQKQKQQQQFTHQIGYQQHFRDQQERSSIDSDSGLLPSLSSSGPSLQSPGMITLPLAQPGLQSFPLNSQGQQHFGQNTLPTPATFLHSSSGATNYGMNTGMFGSLQPPSQAPWPSSDVGGALSTPQRFQTAAVGVQAHQAHQAQEISPDNDSEKAFSFQRSNPAQQQLHHPFNMWTGTGGATPTGMISFNQSTPVGQQWPSDPTGSQSQMQMQLQFLQGGTPRGVGAGVGAGAGVGVGVLGTSPGTSHGRIPTPPGATIPSGHGRIPTPPAGAGIPSGHGRIPTPPAGAGIPGGLLSGISEGVYMSSNPTNRSPVPSNDWPSAPLASPGPAVIRSPPLSRRSSITGTALPFGFPQMTILPLSQEGSLLRSAVGTQQPHSVSQSKSSPNPMSPFSPLESGRSSEKGIVLQSDDKEITAQHGASGSQIRGGRVARGPPVPGEGESWGSMGRGGRS